MTEITVRVLDESGWSLYRDVRLRASAESPGSFTATLAEEADRDERFWRDRMTRSHRLLAERGPLPQGIVTLGPYDEDPSAAEVFGLYVVPEAWGTGASWRLVEAAAVLATQQAYLPLYYWVGTDNGRAVGFAQNFGLRTTDYRPSTSGDAVEVPTMRPRVSTMATTWLPLSNKLLEINVMVAPWVRVDSQAPRISAGRRANLRQYRESVRWCLAVGGALR